MRRNLSVGTEQPKGESAWFVASRDPGAEAFLSQSVAAVNFLVRVDVRGMDRAEIRPLVDDCSPSTRTKYANQLASFSSIAAGDQILSFDPKSRHVVLVGQVTGRYAYEPARIPDHPHVVEVKWAGSILRNELPDAGEAIPSRPGATVKLLYNALVETTGAIRRDPPNLRRISSPGGG